MLSLLIKLLFLQVRIPGGLIIAPANWAVAAVRAADVGQIIPIAAAVIAAVAAVAVL